MRETEEAIIMTAVILEVDETTQELMLRREKINIGWRRCLVLKFYSVKRCFKCWGHYHLARDCTRQTTCHICAGSHKADECKETKKRCVNCMHKIKMFNVKISDDHDALSVEPDLHQGFGRGEEENWMGCQQVQRDEIVYTNAQSVIAHKEEIQHQVMREMKPAVLETVYRKQD